MLHEIYVQQGSELYEIVSGSLCGPVQHISAGFMKGTSIFEMLTLLS
jgi:hypothetical protein